ncbi:MAG: DUF1275 domain-containing protein [Oscillibacter sp.]|nr:DUF1275 domain-containing protein [Oscillibacter sp.]
MSDTFLLSLFLSFSGGFQDAYTYIVRDSVFANAQTGNVVLMSAFFMKGQWAAGARYLFPLLSFVLGVFTADTICSRFRAAEKLHWRQGILLLEILAIALVGFLPLRFNLLANCLVSFSCAMQVHSFRTVHGNAYASTMCIGNLRSGTEALASYFRSGDRGELHRAGYYFGVILIFALGAGCGGVLSGYFAERTIWICCVLLAVAFLIMRSPTGSGTGKAK